MSKKFNFDPLPSIKKEEQKEESVQQIQKESVSSKITFSIEEELKDKMQDFAYWKGYTQQDVILLALEEYLKNENPEPRPEAIKNRKVGRKKKQ